MKGLSFYKKINNIVGWAVFAVALLVYTLTMEKSGSFWDCGEFVSGAYKLQVVHPPGAPFFNIIGRIFTLPAAENTGQVAIMINFLSALSTAFVSLFAFWSTTMVANKILIKNEEKEYTMPNILAIMGAGIVAGLVSTFADSIWFSAVEGEVYALSIFFMTFVVWAVLKWENDKSENADRWLVLIAFMIGLSTGVHLLSLLAIPFVGMIIYYKKFNFNWKGALIAFTLSFIAVGFVMIGVIQGIPKILSVFELMFVNGFSMSFNTGVFIAILAIVALVVAFTYFSHTKNKYYYNLMAVSLVVLLVGYSSYALVPIRAAANTPINMNRPSDAFTLLSYLNREQYGERPLLFGPDYTVEFRLANQGGDIVNVAEGRTLYIKDDATKSYLDMGNKQEFEWANESKMFFPRLGVIGDASKTEAYRAWINPPYGIFDRETRKIISKFSPAELSVAEQYIQKLNSENESQYGNQRYRVKDILTWGDNIKFFFQYQLGYMYMRYFMWNFSGRQNDIQGTYQNSEGGWIVGIPAIDDALGSLWGNPSWTMQNLSPEREANYGYNKYYAIPFILGLVGLVFLFKHNMKYGIALSILFLTTGVFFIVYGNQPPIEPRERDYVIAGSIFTYAIFIGLALIAIYKTLQDKVNGNIAFAVAFLITVIAPVLMGMQGWDDHNRNNRTTAVDFAENYLQSCEPNAILFTQGDNDTYPLWYAQEVEGIRTDVRIINLSLLGVDWYINQLRYKMNDAAPVKITFTPEMLRAGNRDQVQYIPNASIDNSKYYNAADIMKFVAKDDKNIEARYKVPYYLPTKKMSFPIDRAKAEKIGLIQPGDTTSLSSINYDLSKNSLLKNDLLTIDIVANNINERPIYFAVSVAPSAYLGFQKYFEQNGLVYRIVPRINRSGQPSNAPINTQAMYKDVMEEFKFGKLDSNPTAYVDENISRMTMNLVSNFVKLSQSLIAEGENEKAVAVLDKLFVSLPVSKVPYNFFHGEIPGLYLKAGKTEKAKELADNILNSTQKELDYYVQVFNQEKRNASPATIEQYKQGAFTQNRSVMEQLYLLQQMGNAFKQSGETEYSEKIDAALKKYSELLRQV